MTTAAIIPNIYSDRRYKITQSRTSSSLAFAKYKNSHSERSKESFSTSRVTNRDRHRVSIAPTYPVINSSSPVSAKNKIWTSKRIVAILILFLVSVGTLMLPATKAFGRRSLVSPERAYTPTHNVKRVVVRPGDSLWSIAKTLEPKQDPRKIVDQLVKARGTSSLNVGEIIEWTK